MMQENKIQCYPKSLLWPCSEPKPGTSGSDQGQGLPMVSWAVWKVISDEVRQQSMHLWSVHFQTWFFLKKKKKLPQPNPCHPIPFRQRLAEGKGWRDRKWAVIQCSVKFPLEWQFVTIGPGFLVCQQSWSTDWSFQPVFFTLPVGY